MALHFRVLLQVRQHDDQRDSFLIDHAPEVLNCGLERALRRDKQLIVAAHGRVNEVGVDV